MSIKLNNDVVSGYLHCMTIMQNSIEYGDKLFTIDDRQIIQYANKPTTLINKYFKITTTIALDSKDVDLADLIIDENYDEGSRQDDDEIANVKYDEEGGLDLEEGQSGDDHDYDNDN